MVMRIKLRLYPGEDDDLIALFAAIPRGVRAAMVKQGLRAGVQNTDQDPSFDDEEFFDALDAFIT